MPVRFLLHSPATTVCILFLALTSVGCSSEGGSSDELTLYSGRGETLVAPIIEAFTRETGIDVKVRYGGTAELATLLQEEAGKSPACLFWAQDVAALGASKPLFASLPADVQNAVRPVYRDRDGRWIGTSGRARLLIYSPDRLKPEEMPTSLRDLIDSRYKGRIALAPSNGSFVAHVAAMRKLYGDEETRAWLKGLKANQPVIVRNNTAQYQAIADGEADLAVSNNYYYGRFLAQDPDFPVAQRQFEKGDLGNLMLLAGIGMVESCDNKPAAQKFVKFLQGPLAQQYFAANVHEYPVTGVAIVPEKGKGVDFVQAVTNAPSVDLNDLTDMQGSLGLINEHFN